jgi:ribonuclease HII
MTSHRTKLEAGVDEAGRGPLAGPVVVAAVIFKQGNLPSGLADSKRLSALKREKLFPLICEQALAWSIVEISANEIDRINILQATMLGMKKAVEQLSHYPDTTLIDGNRAPQLDGDVRTIVQGDRLVPVISAASILAKVKRDQIMKELHLQYPGYGFDQHKGYPTQAHLKQLEKLGPCPVHRRTFAPVRNWLDAHSGSIC